MPKISIYLPDAMYAELRRRDLPVSQLAQQAFAAALADDANRAWIDRARRRPTGAGLISTEDLMREVDEEFEQ
jgi:post-segregation antitoxin (ccd killing protein)